MEPKKIKKLVLNKKIISNLTENSMSNIRGGDETDGTGYGFCICNPTDLCGTDVPQCPGLNTSRPCGCGK